MVGNGIRIVEVDHETVALESAERSFVLGDVNTHLSVVLPQDGDDLFGFRQGRELGEASDVDEHHGDFGPVPLQQPLSVG